MAENASAKNARKAMLMLAAEVSTNATAEESKNPTAEESIASLISLIKGAPEDAADISRCAIICNQK
jgi:hypothetical protein